MFKRIDHIELLTAAPGRTIAFYIGALGFRERERVRIGRHPTGRLQCVARFETVRRSQPRAQRVQAMDRQPHRAPAGAPVHYERHRPEQTTLYRLVQQHAETFFAEVAAASGASLPSFIKDEFDAFLECGILAHGFLRLRCADCGHDKLVAFSCKRRGFCPSCGARRMAQTAAHLVDQPLALPPGRSPGTSSRPDRLCPGSLPHVPACCLTKECYPAACCRSGSFSTSSMVEGCGHVGEGCGGGQRSAAQRRVVHGRSRCAAMESRATDSPVSERDIRARAVEFPSPVGTYSPFANSE